MDRKTLATLFDLTDRVAIVTGGTRGIGRAIAGALAAEGADVALCARGAEGVDAAVRDLRERGVRAHGGVVDVAAPGELEAWVDEAAAALGGLDLLVANAGGAAGGGLLDSTPADWADTWELNAGHFVRLLRAGAPHVRVAGGGAAVVISSISGHKPAPRAQYGAAKAAEIHLAGPLARELATDGIRVNAVSPGSILFEGGGWAEVRDRDPEAFAAWLERELPAGRLGTPQEVADVVCFLLSDRAAWVNGAHVAVDGAQGAPGMRGY
jgi:3-oxoacyl-[acyl-carrier protein] reductase